MQLAGWALAAALALALCATPWAAAQTVNVDRARRALDRVPQSEWNSNGDIGAGVLRRTSPEELIAFAQQGDARAQNLVGEAYLDGVHGFAKDEAEGVRWLRLSVEQGFAGAQATLGWAYQSGMGGLQVDWVEAARLYRLAAEQGEAGGLVNLGALYLQGRGVDQNFEEARRLFLLALPLDVAAAPANLGLMYEMGYGVPVNLRQAADYYRHCGTQYCMQRLARLRTPH